MTPSTTRPYRRWTPAEDAYLIEKLSRGWTLPQVAGEMGRSYYSVRDRAQELRNRRGLESLTLLTMRASELCWAIETLAALLAGEGAPPGAEAWRAELIEASARCNAVRAALAELRDKELQ